MGPDALLLDTRDAPPEARHLGEYEVVFGCYAPIPSAGPSLRKAESRLLRLQMEEIRNLLIRPS